VTPGEELEMLMMLRGLETSDRQQQIKWRNQLNDSMFADLPGYISAGSDIMSLPPDLLTDAARNLNKRWADHNNSKFSSMTLTYSALLKVLSTVHHWLIDFFQTFVSVHAVAYLEFAQRESRDLET